MTSISELRQRLLHPYYVIHLVYGTFYIVMRLNRMFKEQTLGFDDAETKSLLILLGLSIWKCFIAATAEELSSVLILYTKFYTLCSIYWGVGFWSASLYALGWFVFSTFFPQPWYSGPTKIFELSEAAFRDRVLKSGKSSKPSSSSKTVPVEEIKGPRIVEIDDNGEEVGSKKEKKDTTPDPKYWIVMLYANWSVACLNFEAVLAKLSVQYDVPHLKFGQVDVDIYPDLAEEYGVSKDPASFDLPTLILFQQGKEIRRLPELTVTKDSSTQTKTNQAKDTISRLGWSKHPSTVISMFQLDKIKNEKIN